MLVAAAGAVAVSAPAATAASGPVAASLTLAGTVRSKCGVSVNIAPQAGMIDLTASQGALPVATVTESCNSALGYRVTVSSQNGAQHGGAALVGASQGAALNYNILYDGTPATFSNGMAVVEDSNTPTPSVSKALAISFTANPTLASDTYQDILTVSIAGK
jgi:hypothetical protein